MKLTKLELEYLLQIKIIHYITSTMLGRKHTQSDITTPTVIYAGECSFRQEFVEERYCRSAQP